MLDWTIQTGLPYLNRVGPRLVSVLLAALIGLECVRVIAAFWPREPAAAIRPAPAHRSAAVDPRPIVAAHLFGVAAGDPEDPASPAPSTADLVLVGTIATERPQHGLAIIAADGPAKLYRVGEDIGGASLESVYMKHVILDRAGRLEMLSLLGAGLRPANGAEHVHPEAHQAVTAAAAQPATEATIAQVIQAQPAVDAVSGMPGFRIRPSGNIRAFLQSGLRANDMMTAVNGTPLAGASQEYAEEILSSSFAAQQATVTVLRNGQPLDVSIDLGQRPPGR
jgi:general secretion pathway protein C